MKAATILLALGTAAWAQDAMSLHDAVLLALDHNKSIDASTAARQAAESRVVEAHAGFLPKANYSESWTRSDNPVFVFSSLLTQHRFGEQNFQIGVLNQPNFLNNFQSAVTVDQTLYDGGQTRHAVRSAELRKEIAGESHRLTQTEAIAGVVRAYFDALLGAEQLNAATQAVRSAEADLQRAQEVRASGMSTDADVLSIRVHLAAVQEQRIRRSADLEVARAALNEAIGLPLDTAHSLTTALVRAGLPDSSLVGYETSALADRVEARQAKQAVSLAENQAAEAHSALLPQVVLHGAFEADRQRFYDRAGANWLVSMGLHWNLFNGFGDKARIDESQSQVRRSQAEAERAGSTIRLQVRRSYADLRAAEQRIEVAKASVEEAEESLRITQNRYAAGMNTVTDLLRTETAVLDTKTRYLAAIHDQRVAATMLEMSAGTLNANSEVLN
jgi:outer membrane protein TolC